MTLSYGVMINVSKHQDDIIAKIWYAPNNKDSK
jgi:hypothetical protein